MNVIQRVAEEFNTIRKEDPKTTASNVMVDGSLAITNTLVTKAFITKKYTGTGASQAIDIGVGGIDFTVSGNGSGYWHDRTAGDGVIKNDAGTIIESGNIVLPNNKFILDVQIKGRSFNSNNLRYDGLRGVGIGIATNLTSAEAIFTANDSLTNFTSTGFTLGADTIGTEVNRNTETFISYTRVYTNIEWGLTSQDKRYLCAYTPVTRQEMTLYQGSGVAGHQIPNPLGVKLDYLDVKHLNASAGYRWVAHIAGSDNQALVLNTTAAISANDVNGGIVTTTADYIEVTSGGAVGEVDKSYISYGFANSETQIITQYGGTGVAGNFVETKDVYGVARKPRMSEIKRTDSTGSWNTTDSERGETLNITLNSSASEADIGTGNFVYSTNGFTQNNTFSEWNASGGQYIAIVYFDSQLSTTINTLGVL